MIDHRRLNEPCRSGCALPAPVHPHHRTQVLYRTTDQFGAGRATVATVLRPLIPGPTRLVSYHTAYDALGSRCDPSYTLSGGYANGTATTEQGFIAGYLAAGYTVVVQITRARICSGPSVGSRDMQRSTASGRPRRSCAYPGPRRSDSSATRAARSRRSGESRSLRDTHRNSTSSVPPAARERREPRCFSPSGTTTRSATH